MNEKQEHVWSKHAQRIFPLIEFNFGALLILYGFLDILPILESGIFWVVGITLLILLILYVAVCLEYDSRIDKPNNSGGFDAVLCILVLAIIFLTEIISEVGIASIVVFCGITFILLSFWHFIISLHEDDVSENQIDSV